MGNIRNVLLAGIVGATFAQPLEVAAATFQETVLHSFSGGNADGAYPAAGVTNVKGVLYGTTSEGGGDGTRGTVFSVDPQTGAESVVYTFCNKGRCKDGFNPESGLISIKGRLYGTATNGGIGFERQPFGTAFKIDPKTGAEETVYSFCRRQNCTDGKYPTTGLLDVNGMLYGTTQGGGNGHDDENGTLFALDPKAHTDTVLYDFCSQQNCTDGEQPRSDLIEVQGMIYGTTLSGGANGCGNGQACGTVFSFDPASKTETVLHSFGSGSDGKYPRGALLAANGVLYGTTGAGGVAGCSGNFGCGTVYSIDPSTGAETVLYMFCSQANCADGAEPSSTLIEMKGVLYGTTSEGGGTGCGGAGCGTAFALNPATGTETVLYSFCSAANCTDGANPEAGLTAVHGNLYGTTSSGGASGYGTVFALKK